jgi:hypothetical protein
MADPVRRRWWRRVLTLAALVVLLYVVLVLTDFQPRPVPLVLLCLVAAAMAWTVFEVLEDDSLTWDIPIESTTWERARDPRYATYVRLIESNLTARTPDRAVQDRLAQIADRTLRLRHGLGRADPAAHELLGPDLAEVLDGPARRLPLTELDRCLTKIEEL